MKPTRLCYLVLEAVARDRLWDAVIDAPPPRKRPLRPPKRRRTLPPSITQLLAPQLNGTVVTERQLDAVGS